MRISEQKIKESLHRKHLFDVQEKEDQMKRLLEATGSEIKGIKEDLKGVRQTKEQFIEKDSIDFDKNLERSSTENFFTAAINRMRVKKLSPKDAYKEISDIKSELDDIKRGIKRINFGIKNSKYKK